MFFLAQINRETDILLTKFNIDIFSCLFNNILFIYLLNNDRNSYFNTIFFYNFILFLYLYYNSYIYILSR